MPTPAGSVRSLLPPTAGLGEGGKRIERGVDLVFPLVAAMGTDGADHVVALLQSLKKLLLPLNGFILLGLIARGVNGEFKRFSAGCTLSIGLPCEDKWNGSENETAH
jgi:hypothetical protein